MAWKEKFHLVLTSLQLIESVVTFCVCDTGTHCTPRYRRPSYRSRPRKPYTSYTNTTTTVTSLRIGTCKSRTYNVGFKVHLAIKPKAHELKHAHELKYAHKATLYLLKGFSETRWGVFCRHLSSSPISPLLFSIISPSNFHSHQPHHLSCEVKNFGAEILGGERNYIPS